MHGEDPCRTVNDRLDHLAGDQLLRHVGERADGRSTLEATGPRPAELVLEVTETALAPALPAVEVEQWLTDHRPAPSDVEFAQTADPQPVHDGQRGTRS